ncbi:MAG: enoyl-CoA hydratase-related protein, partial [Candidatus Kryptoniota bacterium]
MAYETLKLAFEDKVATITINRPEKLNALNAVVISELEDALKSVESSTNTRVLIITGAGEKAFAAGADISELNTLDVISGKEFADRGQRVFNYIEKFPKPVIAAVNGYAL